MDIDDIKFEVLDSISLELLKKQYIDSMYSGADELLYGFLLLVKCLGLNNSEEMYSFDDFDDFNEDVLRIMYVLDKKQSGIYYFPGYREE